MCKLRKREIANENECGHVCAKIMSLLDVDVALSGPLSVFEAKVKKGKESK